MEVRSIDHRIRIKEVRRNRSRDDVLELVANNLAARCVNGRDIVTFKVI